MYKGLPVKKFNVYITEMTERKGKDSFEKFKGRMVKISKTAKNINSQT